MAVEIRVPGMGESITEGVLGRWLVDDGSYVKKGDAVFEFETDKANTEVAAPAAGAVKQSVAAGTKVQIDAVVGAIDTAAAAPAKKTGADKKAAPALTPAAPAAPAAVPSAPAPAPSMPSIANIPAIPPATPLPASPVAARMMREHGIDPARIAVLAQGRIKSADVRSWLEGNNDEEPSEGALAPATAPPPPEGPRGTRRERMSELRKTIARRLVEAQHTAAMLTTFNEVDMTAVMSLRTKYKEAFLKKHGVGLGFMSFFVKACVSALGAFPRANAFIEGDEVVFHDYCDIGVAVGTERGLVVPVVRNCETMSLADVERAIAALAQKARDNKIALADLRGGTFTISNGGVYGSLLSTPILNPPQTAILGMHKIQDRAIVDEHRQVVVRPMMYLAVSYDHRMLDGKDAVGFLVHIKECLEQPGRFLLEL